MKDVLANTKMNKVGMTIAAWKKKASGRQCSPKKQKKRTQAAQIALAAAIASDLEDLTVPRKQFPEFIKMCKAVGIETDTEFEMLMGDKKEGAETNQDEGTSEKVQHCKKDRMQGTITHVSKDDQFGLIDNEIFVHREAFGSGHNQLEMLEKKKNTQRNGIHEKENNRQEKPKG